MPDIHYQTSCGETYRIDGLSQRFIVYLHLHGRASLGNAVDPVGAKDTSKIEERVQSYLGQDAAGLVEEATSKQSTLSGENNEIVEFRVTDAGEAFVYDNKARLSMPADLADLAKKVAELRVWMDEVQEVEHRFEDLRSRLVDVEEQLRELKG